MNDSIIAVSVLSFFALAIIGFGPRLFATLLVFTFHALKLVLIVCLFVAITCNVYTFKWLGWTPLSLMLGDQVYAGSLRMIEDGQGQ